MPAFFLYLLKFSISLAVVYLFYSLVLRRLTFYQYNRWYLLAYPVLCLAIPFIDVTPLLQKTATVTNGMFQLVPMLPDTVPQPTNNWLSGWAMAGIVIAVGSLVLLVRLAVQYVSLLNIKKQASLVQADGIELYQINKNITPFSFANGIYVNVHQHSQAELTEIIRHEYVHVKQRHSIDIILAELLCTLNWYNPFAWLLRHAIRQNLEFIADQQVLQSGIDKKDYQYLLLKVVGGQQYRIVNAFNFSSLKKRIAMMNRLKSAKVHLVKFTFVLPLAAVLLLAFRQQMRQQQNSPARQVAAMPMDTIPDNVKTPQSVMTIDREETEEAFIKRHPDVQKLAWSYVRSTKNGKTKSSTGPNLYVYLTNGKQETYLLSNPDDVERFKSKYNELPPVAPPPPPLPPAAPAAPVVMAEAPEAPEAAALPTPTQWNEATVKNIKRTSPAAPAIVRIAPPPPPPVAPPKMPANIKGISINNDKATISLKDGTVEKYDLNNEEENKAFQKKYGKLIPPPPPVPAAQMPVEKVVMGRQLSPLPAKKMVLGKPLAPLPAEKVVTGYALSPAPAPKKVAGVNLSPLPPEKVVTGYATPAVKKVSATTLSLVPGEKVVTGYAKPMPKKVDN